MLECCLLCGIVGNKINFKFMEEKKKPKTAKQLERYFKGAANHWRIDILLLIAQKEGIAVEDVTQILNANFKTISEHIKRLVQAGLVNKKYQGRRVAHSLSPYGKRFYEFIMTFQHSCLATRDPA